MSKKESVFGNYGLFYDQYYKEKNYEEEVDFVFDLAEKQGVKPASLLDMGCGTGRHLEFFHKRGLDCTGFDLSETMLKQAESRLDGKGIELSCDSICSFNNGKKYDIVVSMFAVMGYLVSNEDLLSGLKTASKHLSDSGVFIFDGWFGPAVLSNKPEVRTHKYIEGSSEIIRKATPELHAVTQNVSVNYQITVNPDSPNSENYFESHIMRFFFVQEMEVMLDQAGMKLVYHCPFGEIDNKLSMDTWNVTFVATKK